jgi:hypothetical protein
LARRFSPKVQKVTIRVTESLLESLFMTSKMPQQTLPAPKNLQRAFETALYDLYHAGATGKVSQYRTPIVQRSGRATAEPPALMEQRALTDAARALAQLWKVAPHSHSGR